MPETAELLEKLAQEGLANKDFLIEFSPEIGPLGKAVMRCVTSFLHQTTLSLEVLYAVRHMPKGLTHLTKHGVEECTVRTRWGDYQQSHFRFDYVHGRVTDSHSFKVKDAILDDDLMVREIVLQFDYAKITTDVIQMPVGDTVRLHPTFARLMPREILL